MGDWTSKLVVCTDGAAVIDVYNSVVPRLWLLAAVGDFLVHVLCTAPAWANCTKSANWSI